MYYILPWRGRGPDSFGTPPLRTVCCVYLKKVEKGVFQEILEESKSPEGKQGQEQEYANEEATQSGSWLIIDAGLIKQLCLK